MYTEFGVSLTQCQKEEIKNAFQKKLSLTLVLSSSQLTGRDKLGLTGTQINKIMKAKSKRSNVVLKLSKQQMQKQGGFLGALLAGLASVILPGLIGGITGKGLRLPETQGRGLGSYQEQSLFLSEN